MAQTIGPHQHHNTKTSKNKLLLLISHNKCLFYIQLDFLPILIFILYFEFFIMDIVEAFKGFLFLFSKFSSFYMFKCKCSLFL